MATSELGIDQLAIPLPPFGLRLGLIAPHGKPVRRTVISIDSEKTGMRVELPMLPQLAETLEKSTSKRKHLASKSAGEKEAV